MSYQANNQFFSRKTSPVVSVGLAVFNGEKYLKQAIDSILCQTFTNLELILSDNASTDGTREICLAYARVDPRVAYYRNSTNIGGANNENRTFQLSQGKYFHLAAHDDAIAPDFIEKCIKVLEERPEVVLCHTMIIEIDEFGKQIKTTGYRLAEDSQAFARFGNVTKRFHRCEAMYGLFRSDILRKTELQKNYTNSDRTLLSEISLYGPFYQIPEPLFYKRYHPGNIYLDWRTRMAWFDSTYEGRIVLPYFIQFFDYLATIRKTPLSRFNRTLCYLFMVGPWVFEYGPALAKDLLTAIYMLVHSRAWREQRYKRTNNWSA